MTNREKWNIYTSNLVSPQNYIDWSFRYLIGASLQRRVWMGPSDGLKPDNQAIFPNTYIVLVGPAGIGKGLPLKEVSYFLKYWKMKDMIKTKLEGASQDQQNTKETVMESDLKNAKEGETGHSNKQIGVMEPLLIPVAPDATTYESLVESVGYSFRRINYVYPNGDGTNKMGVYGHCSVCFSLQELASLLRKRTNDTVNFLLGLYDSPPEYEYKTKTQGADRVKNGCCNFIAGTTPHFMQSIFSDELTDEGFASRVFFIFANKARKKRSGLWMPDLTEEQKQYRNDLQEHIKKLSCIYGQVKVTKETEEWISNWINEYDGNLELRANQNSKLSAYYARINIHVVKVAMQLHFMENLTMEIPLETFKEAIDILKEEEKRMHLAIVMESQSLLTKISKRIVEILERKGWQNSVDLKIELWDLTASEKEYQDAMSFLIDTDQVRLDDRNENEKSVIYYNVKERKE